MTSPALNATLNGTIWIQPIFSSTGQPTGATVPQMNWLNFSGLRTWQTMSLQTSFGPMNQVWLGLVNYQNSSYLQGLLPASAIGCNGMGCNAFDEILGCTEWKQQQILDNGERQPQHGAQQVLRQKCTILRTCGAGTGATGTMTTSLTFDKDGELVFMKSIAEIANDESLVSWSQKATTFGDVPNNPCF
jgi:hypothetical protein